MIVNWQNSRRKARRALPAFAFDYVDGGADDEKTLASNQSVFDRWMFAPSVLKEVSQRSLATRLGQQTLSAPLIIAPTGYNGMLRRDADCMLARAAAKTGIGYTQSTVSTASLEEAAIAASGGHHWFQLYVLKEKQVTLDLIERARKANCSALVVSVDAVHFGNREQDRRHYRRPMKLTLKALADVACHPGWIFRALVPDGMPGFGNLKPYLPPGLQKGLAGANYFAEQMDKTITWQTIRWIREQWQGPLYIKGIMTAEDALMAKQCGAEGVVLSNHGGRQLEGTLSPMQVLAGVRAAAGPDYLIIIDSGFRRGTDIVKALALGANAVMMGRPLLYAVATDGERGVTATIDAILAEVDRTLAQLGCATVDDLSPALLHTL